MKKMAAISLVSLTLMFLACKKDKNDKQPEDLKSLFDNTIWTGEIKYSTAAFPEPFSFSFNGFGAVVMDVRLGIASGSYSLDKSDNSITINLPAGQFKAIVSNRKLTNITYAAAYAFKINSAEINNESGQLLANTLWKGTQTLMPNTQQASKIKFLVGDKMNFNDGPDNYPYVKAGPALHLDFSTWGYFFVLAPQNKLKGIFWDTYSSPGTTIYRSYDLTKE